MEQHNENLCYSRLCYLHKTPQFRIKDSGSQIKYSLYRMIQQIETSKTHQQIFRILVWKFSTSSVDA